MPAATTNQRDATSVARLRSGGAVVGWLAAGELHAQLVGADGALQGPRIDIPATRPAHVSLAGLAGGGWVAVWLEETYVAVTQFSQTMSIRFRRYDANGVLQQDTTMVAADYYGWAYDLRATATPEGGFLVGWSAQARPGIPNFSYLRRFDASGQPQGVPFTSGYDEFGARAALLPDGSAVLATRQRDNASQTTVLLLRRIDASGVLVEARAIEATRVPGFASMLFDVTATGEGNVGLAWAVSPTTQSPPQVQAQVLSRSMLPLSNAMATTVFESQLDALGAGPRSTGFAVFPQVFIGFSRGSLARVGEIDVLPAGTMTDYRVIATASTSSVSPTTGATTGPAAPGFGIAAGLDDHLLLSSEAGVPGGANVVLEGR